MMKSYAGEQLFIMIYINNRKMKDGQMIYLSP